MLGEISDYDLDRYRVLFELTEETSGARYLVFDEHTKQIFKARYKDVLLETIRFHVLNMKATGFGENLSLESIYSDSKIPKASYTKIMSKAIATGAYYVLGSYIGARVYYPFKSEYKDVMGGDEPGGCISQQDLLLMYSLHIGEENIREIVGTEELIGTAVIAGKKKYINRYTGDNKEIKARVNTIISQLESSLSDPKFKVTGVYTTEKGKTLGYLIENISKEPVRLGNITIAPYEPLKLTPNDLTDMSPTTISKLGFINATVVDNGISRFIRAKKGMELPKLMVTGG